MNYSARHSYYVKKLMDWLRAKGFDVEKCEFTGSIAGHYTKKDIWGADIVYKNDRVLGFIQLKTSPARIAEGRRQLKGNWPPSVLRHVAYWPPRVKEPIFYEVSTGQEFQGLPSDYAGVQGQS